MTLHRIVDHFSENCTSCNTTKELFSLTEMAALELGFDRVAIVHGLWFRAPSKCLIRMDNFGEFAEIFVSRQFYKNDPALMACQRSSTAFSWAEISKLLPITRKQEAIFQEANRHGLRMGLTLPVGVIGEPPGCCSFVTRRRSLPSHWHCRAATLICAEAFREARRLHGFPARAKKMPNLSPRKREILQLAALGKTDIEIAMILGLKRSTVETYMAQLRQLFDVYSRTQLAILALRFGLIGFEDAMSGF